MAVGLFKLASSDFEKLSMAAFLSPFTTRQHPRPMSARSFAEFEAIEFSTKSELAMASSSDAHCISGIGSAYSVVNQLPDKNSLVKLLKTAVLQKEYAKWYSYFCPGFNRIKNKLVLGI